MKKNIILFISILFLFSCGNNQSVTTTSSNDTSSLTEEENIKNFVDSLALMNQQVNQSHTSIKIENNLNSTSTYTSTLYNNNILIDNGNSAYEDSTFDFQIQTYKTDKNVVKVWYYGENNKDNYYVQTSLKKYTEEELNNVFSLNKNNYFYSMLKNILNDEDYENGDTKHIFNRTFSLKNEDDNLILDCYYEYQTTVTENESSQIEVMNYSCILKINDNKLISSYEKMVGAQYIDDYQYSYALQETNINYEYGQLQDFTGDLIDVDSIKI